MAKNDRPFSKDGLTIQQRNFCVQYLIDNNGTMAARRAGYSKTAACARASKLLKNPKVQHYINSHIKPQMDRCLIDADMIVSELKKVAFLNVTKAFDENGNLLPLSEMDEATQCAVASIDVELLGKGGLATTKKLRVWDKLKALELLGKHVRMFGDETPVKQTVVDLSGVDTKVLEKLVGRLSGSDK